VKKKHTGKVRLAVDFPNLDALVAWVDQARDAGHLPHDSAAFEMDGLDTTSAGVTVGHTFIVRRASERPDASRVA